jgi:hypothetical protein
MAGMRDANDTGRPRLRQDKGCPRQQQAANNGQYRFHVSNIIPQFKRGSTTFGFFSSIFGVIAGIRIAEQLTRQTCLPTGPGVP